MNFGYSELDPPGGGSFIQKTANQIRGAVCGAYHNYKDWYHQNLGLQTPGSALLEQFWNNVCPLEPPYQPPPPPRGEEGACITEYWVGGSQTIRYTSHLDQNQYPPTVVTLTYDSKQQDLKFWGKISKRFDRDVGYSFGGSFGPFGLNFFSGTGIFGNPNDREIQRIPAITSSHTLDWNAYTNNTIIALALVVERVDGLPDDCGAPPPPPPPPLAPPPVINQDVVIVINNNELKIPIEINPRISLPGFTINVKVPVQLPDINLAPQFSVTPTLNVNVAPQLNLNFGLGGVNVSVGAGGGGNNPDVNSVNISNNVTNISDVVERISDKLACDPCSLLEEIKHALEAEESPENPDEDPGLTRVVGGFNQGATYVGIKGLEFVEIELSQLPDKMQFGINSPSVAFAGWIEFLTGDFAHPREQITFEKSLFVAPAIADGFAYTFTNKALGRAIYYYREDLNG